VETSTRKILECYNLLIEEGYVATWDELRAAIGVAQISIGLTDGLEDSQNKKKPVLFGLPTRAARVVRIVRAKRR
jgi:hypothetical protein